MKTFQDVRQTGFEQGKIDGYLHQLELSLKHKTASFGMGLMQRIKPKWFEGVDPFESLAWNDTVNAFQAELAKGGYLEGLLDKYLLNDHTLTFTMEPLATYSEDLVAEETERLKGKISEVTKKAGGEAAARALLEKQELELLEEQGKSNTQDLSCLPSVHVKDIPRQKERVTYLEKDVAGVHLQLREAPTNGLTYFKAINTFENLPEDLRQLLPLFSDAIMRLGTKDMTMEQIEDLIKLKTGGVAAGYHVASSPQDFRKASEGMLFSGMALDRNVSEMYRILRMLILETNFDSPDAELRIRQLLQGSADGVVNNIASSGHSFARGVAEAGLTTSAYLRQQVSGLSQVKLITSLASRPEAEGYKDIIEKLKAIQQFALSGCSTLRTSLVCDSGSVVGNEAALEHFLGTLSKTTPDSASKSIPELTRNSKTFYPLPYQVYYGALAVPTVSYTSAAGPPLQILSSLLTHKHLHHEIREKGGAYGGGAYSRGMDGIFGFYSYRDPNPQNTMKIMRNAGQWATEKDWTAQDLEEAKLSVFQSLDAPVSINSEGLDKFMYGITEEMIQKRREQMLDVTADQVREVAQKYVVEPLERNEECLVFLGEQKMWVNGEWTVENIGIEQAAQEPMVQDEEDVQKAALGS